MHSSLAWLFRPRRRLTVTTLHDYASAGAWWWKPVPVDYSVEEFLAAFFPSQSIAITSTTQTPLTITSISVSGGTLHGHADRP